jgi:glycosyltransferase involved in cell wall biosynthesis
MLLTIMSVPISVLIPAKNEAYDIADCVRCVSWASEVVVVDSGSWDGTIEIASSLNATVVQFGYQKGGPKKEELGSRELRRAREISQVCLPKMTHCLPQKQGLMQRSHFKFTGSCPRQIAAATRIVMKILILPGGKNAARMIMMAQLEPQATEARLRAVRDPDRHGHAVR